MEKQEKIPVLQPSEMLGFHSSTFDLQTIISVNKHPLFHINRLETVVGKMSFPLPPHRKPLFDIIYIKTGYSKRIKGLTMYEFGKSSMFFLPAFQISQHEMMSSDTIGFFCHFDEKLFEFLPKNYLGDNYAFFKFESNPVIHLTNFASENVEAIFERLLSIYEEGEEMQKKLIASYLLALFEEVRNELPTQPKKAKTASFQITESYKNALVKHIYEKQTIAEYAHLLNISSNYLNKCVISSINKTAQDLLNEMLILEAKTLLKYTDMQIAEVAVKLRNQSPSNFCRFFKSQTGITPKEYLEMY
jgi:AraC-like DNA-binding protein